MNMVDNDNRPIRKVLMMKIPLHCLTFIIYFIIIDGGMKTLSIKLIKNHCNFAQNLQSIIRAFK